MQGVAFEPVRRDSRSLFNRSCGVCICILYIYIYFVLWYLVLISMNICNEYTQIVAPTNTNFIPLILR